VRIICISDTHGQHAGLRVPDGDILIHAGDFMTYGNAPREIIDFNTWLARQPPAHKIVIAGNHDRLFESHPMPARALITNAIYLEDFGCRSGRPEVLGIACAAAFQQLGIQRPAWPADTKVLGQNPDWDGCPCNSRTAFGILDQSSPMTDHLGCEELAEVVANIAPRLHVFGHIHGGQGRMHGSNGCEFVNASVLNEHYMLVSEPEIVDLEN
jgi:predicted phosphohydrolase